jgi:hypothetical protein
MRFFWILLAVIYFPTLSTAQINCIKGDCLNGYGEAFLPSGAKYVGNFRNGRFEGKGILYFAEGHEYRGHWVDQVREGEGRLIFNNGDDYRGQFVQNKMEGFGIMQYHNGSRYEGQWANSRKEGEGIFFYANGDRYEGLFQEGKRHGLGAMYYTDGARYVGHWENDLRQGEGVLTTLSGEELSGHWEADQFQKDWNTVAKELKTTNLRNCNVSYCHQENGRYTYGDGSRYTGFFIKGAPEGEGIVEYANGDRYEGSWKQNAPNGQGIMYYRTGDVMGAVWDRGRVIRELFKESPNARDFNRPDPSNRDSEVKIYAVIIGAAQYSYMPPLRYTDDDAYQIYAFLKSPEGGALPDNQLTILIDEQATRQNIIDAMQTTFLRADENDVVMFYFSGHGLQGAFLPVDYDGQSNRLEHEEIKNILKASRAKHKLVLADACHSGSLLTLKTPLQLALEKYYEAFKFARRGTALLMSSKGEEYSLEDGGLRSGVFSYFLIRGLKGEANTNGDHIITIAELFNFVNTNVSIYTGKVQTPTLTGDFDVNMPVAFIRE